MLKLKNIKKDYKVANGKVEALKGITLSFRKNEFVSVLGPSGCGKTTLLNLIGGLDRYTSGDMYINGVSTKNFSDRDFDVYRNHRVGFVFQSYNLIPHQTVLGNVELALTIAGISKEERIERAKYALDKVGLHDQYYKKPNQLSGGQSQRVAIARALVNDPEILLADEPTGALDTKTSGQIMDLIKEIAKDRLVIMVTHNPELAEKYSTRIVNLLDGELQSDSNPFENEEFKEIKIHKEDKKKKQKANKETAKMTWWTTFKLSLQNLISKKSRTILISIASSIGIIGISLVLALSYGLQTYIDDMQDDMLSGNPITISETALDLSSFMDTSSTSTQVELVREYGYVNVQDLIEEIARRAAQSNSMIISNEINQNYIDFINSIPKDKVTATFYDYEFKLNNNIYTDYYTSNNEAPVNVSLSVLETIYGEILKQNEETKPYASLLSSFTQELKQSPNNEEYIRSQYKVLDGKIASDVNEIMLVVNKDSRMTDLLLAQFGYYTQEEFVNMVLKATDDYRYDPEIPDVTKFSYEELMDKSFTWYPNDTVFNKQTDNPLNPFTYNAYSNGFSVENKNGVELKVVGILEPKEEISYGSLQSGFYYTEALTNNILESNLESEIIKYMIEEDEESLISMNTPYGPSGITYEYSYTFLDVDYENQIGFIGETDPMMTMLGQFVPGGGSQEDVYIIGKRDLGGKDLPSIISLYTRDLEQKDLLIEHLDLWNSDKTITVNGVEVSANNRNDIVYSDPLTLIFNLISGVINMITVALIGFTTLSLVVSSVMIAIITYVSVVERVNEIGVIRSLGGRKRDVSNLFVAETAIIGLMSGLIAIGFTYLASFIINLIVKEPLGAPIAIFPWNYAIIMVLISVGLTMISGLVPSRSAAKKDPVDALRAE